MRFAYQVRAGDDIAAGNWGVSSDSGGGIGC